MIEGDIKEFKLDMISHFIDSSWDVYLHPYWFTTIGIPDIEKDREYELFCALIVESDLPCLEIVEGEKGIMARLKKGETFSDGDLKDYYKDLYINLENSYYKIIDKVSELHRSI
jgi:hypothetical protein